MTAENRDRSVQVRSTWSEAGFHEVYSRYIKRIYEYILRRVRNHHDAEDLASQVFAQTFSHLDAKDPGSNELAAWLFTSAHNATLNHVRSRKFVTTISVEEVIPADEDSDPGDRAADADMWERAVEAMDKLPEERRRALLLRFMEDMPHAEIAQVLGRSEGSARVMLHRTVADIRREVS